MTILPEMCRIAYTCAPIQALRWIAWISFVLTIFSGIAYCEAKWEIKWIKNLNEKN